LSQQRDYRYLALGIAAKPVVFLRNEPSWRAVLFLLSLKE